MCLPRPDRYGVGTDLGEQVRKLFEYLYTEDGMLCN